MAQLAQIYPPEYWSPIRWDEPVDSEYEMNFYLKEASFRLENAKRLSYAVRLLEDDADVPALLTTEQQTAFGKTNGIAKSIIQKTKCEVDTCIRSYEAPRCRALLEEVRKRLCQELRDTIYGFIFQGQRVELDEDHEVSGHESIKGISKANLKCRSDTWLLTPGYLTQDDPIRLELVKAWYRNATFLVIHPKFICRSLRRLRWSTNLNPAGFIKRFEIKVRIGGETFDQECFAERLELLRHFHRTCPIVTIILENLLENMYDGHDAQACAQHAAYMFPVLLSLHRLRFKLIVRSELNLKFVVVPEETTVEEWTKKFHEAIESPRAQASLQEIERKALASMRRRGW